MTRLTKSAVRLLDFSTLSGYVDIVEKNQAKRIALIVEGNAGLTQVILDSLRKDEPAGCEVIAKHDGVEALDYLLCRGDYAGRDPHVMPCVILLDLVLPSSDGLGLLREMRAHEQTRRLPVVAFSSAGEPQQVDTAYASGANSYLAVRSGFEPFEESIRRVARYWCVVNEPPPCRCSYRVSIGCPLASEFPSR